MTFIYVVGPSGAGKSALCKALALSEAHHTHINLDNEVKRVMPTFDLQRDGWDVRWHICLQILHELGENADATTVYLIDSGAGALMTTEGQEYFVEHAAQMICINGDPKIIYERNADKFRKKGQSPRPFEDFFRDEYSPQRKRVYQAARITINTSNSGEVEALVSFCQALKLIESSSL